MEEDDKGCPMIRMGVSGSVSFGTGLPWFSRTKGHLTAVCVCAVSIVMCGVYADVFTEWAWFVDYSNQFMCKAITQFSGSLRRLYQQHSLTISFTAVHVRLHRRIANYFASACCCSKHRKSLTSWNMTSFAVWLYPVAISGLFMQQNLGFRVRIVMLVSWIELLVSAA